MKAQPGKDKPFILATDASGVVMGDVLSQLEESEKERIIDCFSKKFVKAQLNYSTTGKEVLGSRERNCSFRPLPKRSTI